MGLAQSGASFPLTRWSVVLRARSPGHSDNAQAAMAELCQLYWPPLYAYARRCGHSPQDAEDLTQGFFANLLAKDTFGSADPDRGRLRSFLLGAFEHFIVQEWRYGHRQKRGGLASIVPMDLEQIEEAIGTDGPSQCSPAELFERRWFETVLERALIALRQEYEGRGKKELFQRIQEYLAWNSGDSRLEEVAGELGTTAGALRVAIFRLRQRYRELVEQQVADTVASEAEMQEELRELRRVLGT